MATYKLCLALLIFGSQLFTPVYAKLSDLPASNLWSSQWGALAGHPRAERLPCLRAAKGACSRAFSSSVTGARNTRKAGAVDPFARPSHTVRTTKHRVVMNNTARIRATARRAGYGLINASVADSVLPNLLLSDNGGRVLDVSLDQPDTMQAVTVETLADYVATVEAKPSSNTSLLNDATGGLGNNAYVSLYDFDEGASVSSGETSAGFQEITSLLDASSTRAAASVPEPGTWLLLGAGLLVLRTRGRSMNLRWGRIARAPA